MTDSYKTPGERLKWLRKEKGLNQGQMAKLLGITQSQYSYLENGKRNMTLSNIITLMDNYDISADYLMTGRGSLFFDAPLNQNLQGGVPIDSIAQEPEPSYAVHHKEDLLTTLVTGQEKRLQRVEDAIAHLTTLIEQMLKKQDE